MHNVILLLFLQLREASGSLRDICAMKAYFSVIKCFSIFIEKEIWKMKPLYIS